jgi:hypothetical protein
MDKLKAFHYRDRAESFMRLMRLGNNSEIIEDYLGERRTDYEDGTALLAVHASIALADAALVLLTGERSTAQNHAEAVSSLRKACSKAHVEIDGIRHFQWLVSHKDEFAYGDRRVKSELVAAARDRADKFAAWLYRTFPALAESEEQ